MTKIGIMGGTFNPIHIGHLIVADDARQKCGLDRVLFVPSGLPPHKPNSEVISSEHRYEMVKLAVASNPNFEASRIEIDMDGYSYTVNTLLELKERYGQEASYYFIIGADVIPELVTWKEYEKVFQLCEFIAVLRPGFSEPDFNSDIKQLKTQLGLKIHPLRSRLIDISSTDIRECCNHGRGISYLVPDDVEKYIFDKGLYKAALKNDGSK